MVTLQGINVLTGSSGPAPAEKPQTPQGAAQTEPTDSLAFSQAASTVAFVQQTAQSGADSEIRQELVDAAKARIAEGAYKLQSTVLQVAARVAVFVE
jgi:anti-sigma28 factor (negative regulator of flagellin synthesis)